MVSASTIAGVYNEDTIANKTTMIIAKLFQQVNIFGHYVSVDL